MKTKTKSASLLALIPLVSKAGIGLAIFITILIIGGIIIFFLARIIKETEPPGQKHSQIDPSSNWVVQYWDPQTNYDGQNDGALDPYTFESTDPSDPPPNWNAESESASNSFTFEYGLDATNGVWVGINVTNQVGSPVTLEDDAGGYVVAFAPYGTGMTLIFFESTNTANLNVEEYYSN